jgi:hypothetical protein
MTRRTLPRLALGLALGATALPVASAQAQYYGNFHWNYAVPMGDSKRFTDNGSWLSFAMEGRRVVSPNVTVGFYAGYTEFWDATIDFLQTGNAALTGDQYRDLIELPLMVTAHYYPGSGAAGTVRPFLGLGVGTYWVQQYLEIGTSALRADHWHFGMMPQVGVAVPVRVLTYATLTATYHYAFSNGNYIGGQDLTPRYWDFGIGFAYGNP